MEFKKEFSSPGNLWKITVIMERSWKFFMEPCVFYMIHTADGELLAHCEENF